MLQSQSFDELIGLFESHCLEFKSEPYRLNEDRQKFELAKDVSALANSGGGVILIGIATERRNDSSADCASEIRPIQRSLCNLDQMRQCIAARTFPSFEVKMRFYEVGANTDKGLVLCHVPPQDEESLPVLVRKPYDEEDEAGVLGAYIGIFERARTHTSSFSVERFHNLLQAGQGMVTEISGKLDVILRSMSLGSRSLQTDIAPGAELADERSGGLIDGNEMKNNTSKQSTDQVSGTTDIQEDANELASSADLDGKPFFWLSASPEQLIDLSRILESRQDPIVRILEEPPTVREGGFDVSLNARSKIVSGDRRRLALQNHGALELTTFGKLLFVGHANSLCWGRQQQQEHAYLINQLSLTELVMLFSELASRIFSEAGYSGIVELGFGVSNFRKNKNVRLEAGPLSDWGSSRSETANESTFQRFIKLDPKEPDVGASKLICSVYNYFGIESDQAPYMKINSDGVRTVNRAIIASGGR